MTGRILYDLTAIADDIPIPEVRAYSSSLVRETILQLTPKQSVAVVVNGLISGDTMQKRIYGVCRYITKRHPTRQYITRQVREKDQLVVRVWRNK